MKKFLFLLLTFLGLTCIFGVFGCKSKTQPAAFTITFVIDDNIYLEKSANFGEAFCEPEIPETEDNLVFKGWYITDEYIVKWDFKEALKDNLTLYGYFVEETEETFNVSFYDDGKLVKNVTVPNGSSTAAFIPATRDGYKFNGWLAGSEKFDFSAEINNDVVLKADWELIIYTLKFIVDNEQICECTYSVENKNIRPPEVPFKEHYTGEWESYNLTLEDGEVKAVYTPVTYTAAFIADNKEISNIKYTVEDEVEIPEVPAKTGYKGVWSGLPISGGNVVIDAIYTPVIYSVDFEVDGKIIYSTEYTVENKNITPPAVPERKGYSGQWRDVEFEVGNVTIDAIYNPIQYSATFIDGNKIISVLYFDVENAQIKEPEITKKLGYTSRWSEYKLEYENVTVRAIHTPVIYTATFIIDGNKFSETQFTVENDHIQMPDIEERLGYTFEWETYEIATEDIEISGRFTPITYYVTFMADEVVVDTLEYTVENKNIIEPEPPEKEGFTVSWEEYTISYGNVTVNAEYTPIVIETPNVEPDNGNSDDDNSNEDNSDNDNSNDDDSDNGNLNNDGSDRDDSDDDNSNDDEYDYDNSDDCNFIYELQNDGTYTVTGYRGNKTELIFPSVYNGIPVTTIGLLNFDGALISKKDIVKIEIREGVKKIDDDAFMIFTSLSEVCLPESLESIGRYAFAFCTFTEIYLPDNISEFGEQVFAYSNLTSVKLPDKLQEINQTFSYCTRLTDVRLGSNLTAIRAHDFYGCTALKSLTVPRTIKLIESEAFYESGLEEIQFENVYGWHVCDEYLNPYEEINSKLLEDKSTAALMIKNIYKSRCWKNEI